MKSISDYVPGLESIPDDEIVMFNIGLTSGNTDLDKIDNVLKKNNLEIGDKANEWYVRREKLGGQDPGKYELFSPLMKAKDAKQIMPNLIADLDNAHVSSGLVVPIKAKELFQNLSKDININVPEIDLGDLQKFIIGAIKRRDVQFGFETIDELQKYGIKNQEELPITFYSLEELEQQYPKDKFLFSGSTASDDFLLISSRVGRTGTVYATPNIEYAAIYDGVTNVGSIEGTTATGNRYVSSVIGKVFDQDVKVGFINVYKQNPQDMYFSNFGMEDCRQYVGSREEPQIFDMCEYDKTDKHWKDAHRKAQSAPNKRLTRDQALNGYVYRSALIEIDGKKYMPFSFNSETFVTPEKNPLHTKILHIEWNGNKLFIPVNENHSQKIISKILAKRKAKIEDTFSNDFHTDVLDRLQKQKAVFTKLMFANAMQKMPKDNKVHAPDASYDR